MVSTYIRRISQFSYRGFVFALVFLVATLMHAPMAHAFSAGTGTAQDPYIISSCSDWEGMGNLQNTYFSLSTDLDCTGEGNGILVPYFYGNLNGNGHTLTVSMNANASDLGLFYDIIGGTINNLKIAGSITNNAGNTGGLAAHAFSSALVEYVASSVNVSGSGDNVGGLFGTLETGSTIKDSYTTGTVSSPGHNNVGGLVGTEVDGTISDSYATGSISGGDNIGGLVGYMGDGTVSIVTSFSTGAVSGANGEGGLVGTVSNSGVTLSSDYFDATTSGMGTTCTSNNPSLCYSVDQGGASPTYFKNDNSNPPLSLWNFTKVWSAVSGGYPILVASPNDAVAPTVTTNATPDTIGITTATLRGTITDTGNDNPTARGFNYGTSNSYGSQSSADTGSFGTGDFTETISGLVCATTYHYQAFATNNEATATGSDATFTTSPCPVDPTVTTTSGASSLTPTGAVLGGNITDTGGIDPTARYIEYGTSNSYGSQSSADTGSFGTGDFTETISGLTPNTLYHFAACATNTAGTACGGDQTFTTPVNGEGRMKVTITDANSAPITGAVVSIMCNGGAFAVLGTTDANGVVEAIPGGATNCTDGNTVAVRAAKATYLTNTSSYDPYYGQYYYVGVDPEIPATFNGSESNTYTLTLYALETGNTDSYLAQYWSIGQTIIPQFPATAPDATVNDATISQHLLDNASPMDGISSQYVTRYTKTTHFDAGNYTFSICSDDGERLYIDGAIIGDNWIQRGRTCDSIATDITAGTHTITLEYFQEGGGQSLDFSYNLTIKPALLENGFESADTAVTPTNPGTENGLFANASAVDGSYWTTALSTNDSGYDSQVFKFKPDLTGFVAPKFTASWVGHGAVPDTKKVYISLWNFVTSSWDQLASNHCATDCSLTGTVDGAAHKDTNGNVWLWAKADNSYLPPVISSVTDNNGLLPVQWTTDQSATSELVWDTVSHTNPADYASRASDSDLITSHSITPTVSDNTGQNWKGVTSSGDGTHLAAVVDCGDIWTSVDSGVTWVDQTGAPTGQCWTSISMSSDGLNLVASIGGGDIWSGHYNGTAWAWTDLNGAISTNYPTNQGFGWQSIALSGDGNHIAVVPSNGDVWTASYGASTWTWVDQGPNGMPSGAFQSVASSSDGSRIVIGNSSGDVYTGLFDGTNWTWTDQSSIGSASWYVVASSADGRTVYAGQDYGGIWKGTFDGTNWTWAQTNAESNWWQAMATSGDGSHIVAGGNCGDLATSADGGNTWTVDSVPSGSSPTGSHCYNAAASDSTGTKLAAAGSSGSDVFISSNGGSTWTSATGTRWYYRVISTNANGQTTVSPEYSFTFASTNSCPFIFTWNGTKYQFVIDASNSGNLGVGLDRLLWDANPFYKDPNANNGYPNPLSYTSIPTGALVPKTVNGETYYDIKTTTELDEVNYYDKAALEIIDHDPSVDVYPDYQNNGVFHSIEKNAPAPISVIDQSGKNVTNLVSADDNQYWHSRLSTSTNDPTYLTIKLTNDATTPAHLKLLIKGTKEGPLSGGKGSDALQYENAQGQFVNVPANYNPFVVTRAGAPSASRNFQNTYGVQYKVIDLSGLTIKDNTIRLVTTNTLRQWDIDWLAVDTSPDTIGTVTEETPYYADLHERGISAMTLDNPSDPKMAVQDPVYDQLVKTEGEGFPLTGNATKYGDVTPLLASVDDKFVIMTQGDELALKYAVPQQPDGTQRDFIYYTWDYHKPQHDALGHTITPLPFNEMTEYPYNTAVENYPSDQDHQDYQNTWNTRVINWGTVQQNGTQIHHSLNTDFVSLTVTEGNAPTPKAPVVAPVLVQSLGTLYTNIPTPTQTPTQTQSQTTSSQSSTTTSGNTSSTSVVGCDQGDSFSIITGEACPHTSIPTNTSSGNTVVDQSFHKNLKKGMTDLDVARLQHYLNTHKFAVAKSGAGSLGNESTLFGAKTVAALKKFQKSLGLPQTGYFGPQTRAWVNAHLQ